MASGKQGDADVELSTGSVGSSQIDSSHESQIVCPFPNLLMNDYGQTSESNHEKLAICPQSSNETPRLATLKEMDCNFDPIIICISSAIDRDHASTR